MPVLLGGYSCVQTSWLVGMPHKMPDYSFCSADEHAAC